MNSLKIFRTSLITAALLLLLLTSQSSASANLSSSTQQPTGLGPYIEIWNDIKDNQTPVVAYNPQFDEYLVVWSTVQGTLTTDVWAKRMHIDGSPDNYFNVDSSPAVQYTEPVIAYSPAQHEYLVAFTDSTDLANMNIYARTFSWNGGSRSSRLEIDIRTLNQDNPAIAYNELGNEFLIVYDTETASGTHEVVGRRYRLSDHTLLPAVTIASSGTGQHRSGGDVAYNPARNTYFVTYLLEDTVASKVLLVGRQVSFDLANLGPEVDIASGGTAYYYEAAIAAGRDGYLVAYGTLGYIYGRQISGEGVPLGPANGFSIPSGAAKENYRSPDVSFLGTSTYLVTWYYFDPFSSDAGDVFAQYINASTGSLRGPNLLVDTNPYLDRDTSVACSTSGACLIAYEHNGIAYPGGDVDIRGRIASLFKTYIPLAEK